MGRFSLYVNSRARRISHIPGDVMQVFQIGLMQRYRNRAENNEPTFASVSRRLVPLQFSGSLSRGKYKISEEFECLGVNEFLTSAVER